MLKRIINLRNIYGCAAVCLMFAVIGAAEAEMYITASVLIAGTGISTYLTLKEDGRIRHKNRSHRLQAKETYQ